MEVVAHPRPALVQLVDAVSHRHGHLHRPGGSVRARERVVEEDHQPVAGEALQRALEAGHEIAERSVVLREHLHHVLGLDCLRERREAAQVAEHNRDLAAMAFEERLLARRNHEIGELW